MSGSTSDSRGPTTQWFVVGVDLGGTKVRAGLVNPQGDILADVVAPTDQRDVPTQVGALVRLLTEKATQAGGEVLATGVGGPGVPSQGLTGFSQAPNLAALDGGDLLGALTEVLGHPVVLENDVNVAAIGELHYGVGKLYRNFVCIAVGTGVGMGIIVDGRLLKGGHGAAGEIGYLPIGADPLDPANQRRGPMEEVLAGDRLAGRCDGAPNAESVFDRAAAGDEAASAAIDIEAMWLAHAIVAVNAILDTEVVVLVGGIGARRELRSRTLVWLEKLGVTDLPVVHSSMGSGGAITGAAHLAAKLIREADCEPVDPRLALDQPAIGNEYRWNQQPMRDACKKGLLS